MADNDRSDADQRRIIEDERRQRALADTAADRDRADRDDADERRRSLAGLASDDDRRAGDVDPAATATAAPADPRRWDVPDEREELRPRDEPTVAATTPVEQRTTEVPVAAAPVARPTDQVPATPVYAVQQPAAVVAAPSHVVHEDTVTERGFSPGQVLVALAGAAFLALGIAAVARTGLQGSWSEPVEPVLGWNHTALLGLYEIGIGAVMLLSSLRAGARWLGGLAGIAAIVGGVLIVGELDYTVNDLGTERDFGWVPIVIGAVALVGAAIPRIRRTRRVTTTRAM